MSAILSLKLLSSDVEVFTLVVSIFFIVGILKNSVKLPVSAILLIDSGKARLRELSIIEM